MVCYCFSNIDFDGSTVGLAYVGTLCTDYSTGVIQVPKKGDFLHKNHWISEMMTCVQYPCALSCLSGP